MAEEGRAGHQRVDAELDARIAELGWDSTCVMLYTSGTTGKPKGVVLSNRNVIETARNSSDFDRLRADDDILAYLPMAWVGDFIFSVGQAYWTGFCVNCPESPATMMTDLRTPAGSRNGCSIPSWPMPARLAPPFWTASPYPAWTG